IVVANGSTLVLTNVQGTDAGTYDVLVSTSFGILTSAVAAVSVNLATNAPFNPNADGPVGSIVVQADGRIVLGGYFTSLAGENHARIGRLSPDGTADSSFKPSANGPVNALAMLADGRILVGGSFTQMSGQNRGGLACLDTNGSIDAGFSTT